MSKRLYCGIDYHKNKSSICIKDELGNEKEVVRILSSKLVSYLSNRKGMLIGVESSGGVNHLVSELKSSGHEVKIINSNKFKAIGIGGKKTDKRDASMIAEALRLNFIPEVYHKSKISRELKSLLISREMLVRSRVNIVNHVRGLLREYGITMPKGIEAFWKQIYMKTEEVENVYLRSHLEYLSLQAKEYKAKEEDLNKQIEESLNNDRRYSLLRTLPGIGLLTSAAFIAVIDDVSRFKNSKHFASYLGLVPREYSSGDKRRMGSITRSGSELLRRYLIHGARAVLLHSLNAKYDRLDKNRLWARRLKNKSGINKAVVALAHRMAKIGFSMLVNESTYDIDLVPDVDFLETEYKEAA